MNYLTAKGVLAQEERQFLRTIAAKSVLRSCNAMLNIGVEYGASCACLRAGNPLGPLYAIDLDISKVDPDIPRLTLIEGDSGLLHETWKENLGVLFVDGSHSKGGVALDCKLIPWLCVGGIVAFHDCYWQESIPGQPPEIHRWWSGVNESVEEWFHAAVGFRELPHIISIRVFERVYVA